MQHFECGKLLGTKLADSIRASGRTCRADRPDTRLQPDRTRIVRKFLPGRRRPHTNAKTSEAWGTAMPGNTFFEASGRRSVAKGLAGLAFGSGALASRRAVGQNKQAPQLRRETMAKTPAPPREIQTLIDNHINGFNSHDTKLYLSVFGDTAIIIDGIAPYRWLNPNAPANWLADVEKWRKNVGVSAEHLSYEMGFWNMEGSDAYAVIAGTLMVTIKGQTTNRTGTLAFTFSKHGEEWKIDAQAWGRTS